MISPITLGGNTVSVVSLPTPNRLQSLDLSYAAMVATVTSVFTGQVQAQQWPGADSWSGTATLPPLTQAQFRSWRAGLMQLEGMANAFQLGDPNGATPAGSALGTPVVDGSQSMVAGGINLYTKGWEASQSGLLLPGDYIQVGYRLHTVLDEVNSDSSGKAVLHVGPSLREVPPDGQSIITTNPVGLFRLAQNKTTWSTDFSHLTHLSFQFTEYR